MIILQGVGLTDSSPLPENFLTQANVIKSEDTIYTSRKSYCAIFMFTSLLNGDQLLKERICSQRNKFFPVRVDPFSKGLFSSPVLNNRKSCCCHHGARICSALVLTSDLDVLAKCSLYDGPGQGTVKQAILPYLSGYKTGFLSL